MSKILITGGTGFIGSHLANSLKDSGHDIIVIDNLSRGKYLNKKIRTLFIDLTDRRRFWKLGRHKFDYIFHLAAVNGTKNFYERPYFTSRTNLLSLINILDWINKESPYSKLIWTSSSEVYSGNENLVIPTREDISLSIDDIHNPRFSYASSKIAGESMVLNQEIETIIVRPHNIYGPRMGYDHVISELMYKFDTFPKDCDKGQYNLMGADNTRSFCYIDDFIKGLLLLMYQGKDKQIYNVGNDTEEISIYKLANKILKVMDLDIKINKIGYHKGSVSRRCPDLSKIKRLGYEPRINLDKGLEETYRWYKE